MAQGSHHHRVMRSKQLTAAVIAALSCAICVASCVQSEPDTTPTDTQGAPSIESGDERTTDVADEPPTIEQASAGDTTLLVICLALAPASVPAKEEFCRSLPDPADRAGCWKYRFNKLEWIGWCYAAFSG